ncbi:hypothetical protein PC110_g15296 [Phytophthora cactorum]|uniref:Uncharacterized protein n=1 Tax=Phytophthora cactorum TaxID=29920 RepID=A0A329RXM6_9STRA|nr:hypothetical protein PC110_g15296 [Phytophthora cactorum]
MKVHWAAWVFVESEETKQARAYAAMRKLLTGKALAERDSRLLRGRGGPRVRKSWLQLLNAVQKELMEQTPRDTVPRASDDIIDESRGLRSRIKGVTTHLERFQLHLRVVEPVGGSEMPYMTATYLWREQYANYQQQRLGTTTSSVVRSYYD